MPPPTTAVLYSASDPVAPPGLQNTVPQSDGGQPAQLVSQYMPLAIPGAGGVAGSVKPDGTSITQDLDGTIHSVATAGGGGTGGGVGAAGLALTPVHPSGARDGSNTQFTLPAPPVANTFGIAFLNGVQLEVLGASAQYAVQGTQFTMALPPQSTDVLTYYYYQGTPNSESGGGGSVNPVGSPTFIQGNNNYTTGTTITCAYISNNIAGDCLIVDVVMLENFSGAGSLSISDSQGNTWTRAMSNDSNTALVETWYALNCKAGANTVTVAYSTGTTHPGMAIAIHEYAAVQMVSAFDIDDYAFSISIGGLPITLSVTTTVDGDLLHLYGSCANAATFSNGSSWTQREANTAGAVSLTTYDGLAGAAGAYSNTLSAITPAIEIQGYLLALKSL